MSLQSRLTFFAQELAPCKPLWKNIKQINETITQDLQDSLEHELKIDRVKVLGSIGKKTSLWINMDIDIVAYVDHIEPPYWDVINKMVTTVRSKYDEDCEVTKHAIKFKYNDFAVDLLPATNFNPTKPRMKKFATKLVEKVLKLLSSNSTLVPYDMSTSLSELAVDFLKKKSPYTHTVCRLAKYWTMSVQLAGSCPGRSTVIELLAVKAAEKTEQNYGCDIIEGFREFLEMIKEVETQEIFWLHYYEYKNIPFSYRDDPPYLIDPTNPSNNLLGKVAVQYLTELKPFASKTLDVLEKEEMRSDPTIHRIFFTQSTFKEFCDRNKDTPYYFLLGIEKIEMHMPVIKIRTSERRKFNPKSFFRLFTAFLCAVSENVKAFTESKQKAKAMLPSLEGFIGGVWHHSSDEHGDRDVSCYIPTGRCSSHVIVVSFDISSIDVSDVHKISSDDDDDSDDVTDCLITRACKYIMSLCCCDCDETYSTEKNQLISDECPERNRANAIKPITKQVRKLADLYPQFEV